VDPVGNIYIADTGHSVIRKVASGTGAVTTVAGNGQSGYFGDNESPTIAALSFPRGVAFDSQGDMLIADSGNFRLRLVTTDNVILSIGGTGSANYGGDGRPAPDAQLLAPKGLAVDGAGNLYIADSGNNRIRKIVNGTMGTVAGTGVTGFSGDGGSPLSARLAGAEDVAVTSPGHLFIADTGNSRVRDLSQFSIGTIAGNGNSTDLSVAGIAVDSAGNLFIADSANHRVRKVPANGTISTIAGDGVSGFSGDDGPALSARVSTLAGIAVDTLGEVYVVDAGNQRVRKILKNGFITTVAGNGQAGFSGDGGPAILAQLDDPSGIAVDGSGNFYIADTGNHRVRKVSADGTITTIAGNGIAGYTGDGGAGITASLMSPMGVAVAKFGVVYVSDTDNNAIRALTPGTQPVVIASVQDAGSELATPLSPGKIVVIYGSGLGPDQLVVNQPVNNVFGQQLAGTTVSFRGIIAPIYYTSATQVAAIVPYGIEGSTSVPVVVSYQGGVSLPFDVQFADVSPGFFTANASGAGQLAAINVADGTLNSAANPVKTGSYIALYATGEGQTSPAGADGKLAPLTLPIPAPLAEVSATVDGIDATVSYAGGVPGTVAGLMQINVLIPPEVTPGGYVPIVLKIGDTSTVDGAVWIAVAP
jgi:uncharacterized protein (TIGR03437 family)